MFFWTLLQAHWWWLVPTVVVVAIVAVRGSLILDGNHYGIVAAVGLNGHGKTLKLVESMAVPSFRQGVPVVANFRLYPERIGCDPSLFVPLRSWRNIIKAGVHLVTLDVDKRDEWPAQYRELDVDGLVVNDEGEVVVPRLEPDGSMYSITGNQRCTILLDEINAVMPSRSYQSVPPELLRVINQLRKHDVVVGWSAPAWERADKSLREVTSAVWVCRGYLLDRYERSTSKLTRFPKALRDDQGRKVVWAKGWPPRRVFRFKLYDAADFEEFSLDATQQQRISAKASVWYWRSKHMAQVVYGSSDGVMLLDHLDAFTGTCPICDGTRQRHKCKGHDELTERGPERPAEPAEGPPLELPTRFLAPLELELS